MRRKCFDLEGDPASSAEAEHLRWMMAELIMGFSPGEKRDKKKFIHNCIVPFDELSEEDKYKDMFLIKSIPFILGETEEC